MDSLEAELSRARALDVDDLADAVAAIGFECTRCGACCRGSAEDPHTATVFPDEVRAIQAREGYDWRDVARPMPFGLTDGPDGPQGETFEWALSTDGCGDCRFYAEDGVDGDDEADDFGDGADDDLGRVGDEDLGRTGDGADGERGPGRCTVYGDRPLICRTYPFSVVLDEPAGDPSVSTPDGSDATGDVSDTAADVSDAAAVPSERSTTGITQPMGEAVDQVGAVRAHECEGLGREIDRADARSLAASLKERAVTELEEAIAVRDAHEPADPGPGQVVVHDSEGAKRPDGRPRGG